MDLGDVKRMKMDDDRTRRVRGLLDAMDTLLDTRAYRDEISRILDRTYLGDDLAGTGFIPLKFQADLDALGRALDDLTEDLACEIQTELRMGRGSE